MAPEQLPLIVVEDFDVPSPPGVSEASESSPSYDSGFVDKSLMAESSASRFWRRILSLYLFLSLGALVFIIVTREQAAKLLGDLCSLWIISLFGVADIALIKKLDERMPCKSTLMANSLLLRFGIPYLLAMLTLQNVLWFQESSFTPVFSPKSIVFWDLLCILMSVVMLVGLVMKLDDSRETRYTRFEAYFGMVCDYIGKDFDILNNKGSAGTCQSLLSLYYSKFRDRLHKFLSTVSPSGAQSASGFWGRVLAFMVFLNLLPVLVFAIFSRSPSSGYNMALVYSHCIAFDSSLLFLTLMARVRVATEPKAYKSTRLIVWLVLLLRILFLAATMPVINVYLFRHHLRSTIVIYDGFFPLMNIFIYRELFTAYAVKNAAKQSSITAKIGEGDMKVDVDIEKCNAMTEKPFFG